MDGSEEEKYQVSHIEVVRDVKVDVKDKDRKVKLDSEGLPLVPQPSDDPEDPLNWPLWLKCAVLTQAALLGAVGNLKCVFDCFRFCVVSVLMLLCMIARRLLTLHILHSLQSSTSRP